MEVVIHASAFLYPNSWETGCSQWYYPSLRLGCFGKGLCMPLVAATFSLSQANVFCALCGKFSLELSEKSNENIYFGS